MLTRQIFKKIFTKSTRDQLRCCCQGYCTLSSSIIKSTRVVVFSQSNRFPSYIPRRDFYRMLNAVFNRPDNNRIKEVGAERACAEWLLRCGARVRWAGSNKFFTDYNSLPQTGFKSFHIEEIDCNEAAVMDIGFAHLEGLTHVKKISFNHCPYLEDEAIAQVARVKDSLEHLEVISCGDITERGLLSFTALQKLQRLHLHELPAVRNKAEVLSQLHKALPKCEITFTDVDDNSSIT